MPRLVALALCGLVGTTSAQFANEKCISEADMVSARDAWGQALVSIGQAFTGDAGVNAMDCTAARAAAEGALYAAYGYNASFPVLFKPTLTTSPTVFRNTYAGALSYFVGPCAPEVWDRSDGGFALGYSAVGRNDKDMSNYKGFKNPTWTNFNYVVADCDHGIAQGQLTVTSVATGETSTVDKTFAYRKAPAGALSTSGRNIKGAPTDVDARPSAASTLPFLLVTHHSSLAM